MISLTSSILKIFYRPQDAFRELNERVPPKYSVVFFFAATAASYLLARLTPEQTSVLEKAVSQIPHMGNLMLWRVVLIPLAFVWVSTTSLGLHLAADLNGGHAPFHKLWNVLLWISAIEILLWVALPSGWPFRLSLSIGKIVLICVAIAVIYDFSPGRAFLSYVMGMFGSSLVLSAIIAAGVFLAFLPIARQLKKNTTQPVLIPVHMPAAYNWLLQSPDGQFGKMAQYKGHVTVLNVWATWCAPCRAEMPSLQRLYERVHPQGIEVLGVSNEKSEIVKKYLQGKSFLFPLYSHTAPLPPIFESTALPTTYILSEDGYIVAIRTGAANWDDPAMVAYVLSLKGKHFASGELSMGEGPHETADLIIRQANWENTRGENAQAVEYYHKGLDLLSREPIPQTLEIGVAYNGLGNAYFKQNNYTEAVKCHLEAVNMLRKTPGVKALDIVTALRNSERDYRSMNRLEDANRIEREAKMIEYAGANK
jgi:thiol-disulfide isomerase/thioredoxin